MTVLEHGATPSLHQPNVSLYEVTMAQDVHAVTQALMDPACVIEGLCIHFGSCHGDELRLAVHSLLRAIGASQKVRRLKLISWKVEVEDADDNDEEMTTAPSLEAVEGAVGPVWSAASDHDGDWLVDTEGVHDVQWVAVLARALANNTTLETLWMESCYLGDKGAALLGRMLAVNTTLTQLLVCSAYWVGDVGMQLLGAGLSQNRVLRDLDLWDNRMATDQGLAALLRALSGHPSVRRVHLTTMGLGVFNSDNARALVAAVDGSRPCALEHVFMEKDYALDGVENAMEVESMLEPLVERGILVWGWPDWESEVPF